MKNVMMSLIAAAGMMVIFAGNVKAGGDGDKATTPNGNYKHYYPVSKGHTFKNNFGKSYKDTVKRNYKQQNEEKRNVKFGESFTNIPKTDTRSYKHPQGL